MRALWQLAGTLRRDDREDASGTQTLTWQVREEDVKY